MDRPEDLSDLLPRFESAIEEDIDEETAALLAEFDKPARLL